jgi:hypothetical protein
MHLYSISADGGALTTLTPGDFEVENIALPPDKSTVVFSTNKSDIDRRHLWSISVAGGAPKQITSGEGIEMYPVVFDNGRRVAFLRFHRARSVHAVHRQRRWLEHEAAGAASFAARFSRSATRRSEQVIFKAADGLEIHGQLFKPKNASGKLPGSHLYAWRAAAADAARLALHVLLPQLLRDESVSRESGLPGPVGQLSQRHRLWPRLSSGSASRRARAAEYQDVVAAPNTCAAVTMWTVNASDCGADRMAAI